MPSHIDKAGHTQSWTTVMDQVSAPAQGSFEPPTCRSTVMIHTWMGAVSRMFPPSKDEGEIRSKLPRPDHILLWILRNFADGLPVYTTIFRL